MITRYSFIKKKAQQRGLKGSNSLSKGCTCEGHTLVLLFCNDGWNRIAFQQEKKLCFN